MKITSLLTGALAFSLLVSAQAANVTVDITGATAFRSATLNSIKARYEASGQPFKYAHELGTGNVSGSKYSIWIGTFPGVTGTTTIRTSFNGSVEGIKALVDSPAEDPVYFQSSVLDSTTAQVGGAELANSTATKIKSQSEIAFSDVNKSSTPFSSAALQPSQAAAGVVVFTMIGSEGSPLTNVTSQQFKALFGNGYVPLSLFTAEPTDDPFGDAPGANAQWVVATGRNDGSGTRTTYLAETGYGITKPVRQFVTIESGTNVLNTIQVVPAGGVNDSDEVTPGVQQYPGQSPKNASTIWGQDIDGNGGYDSGGTLSTDMGKTGETVTMLDETHEDLFGAPQKLTLVSWLSLADSVKARDLGAVILAYNGVKLDDVAASGPTMSEADKAKVVSGLYTAWGYEQMYRRNDIVAGDTVTVYNGIKNNLVLGSAGIPISEMKVGRDVDGGVVAP